MLYKKTHFGVCSAALVALSFATPALCAADDAQTGSGSIAVSVGHSIRSYDGALDQALSAMEEGKQIQALSPLLMALGIDRNEPYGVITLGTLYLQSGNAPRAAREFARAHMLAPDEPLAVWGMALADLEQGSTDPAALAAIPPTAIPAQPIVAAYARLMHGSAADVAVETRDVTAQEPNDLRLELAAFAAQRSGDDARARTLLAALLERPEMKILAEDRALCLTFEPNQIAEGQAPALPDDIGFAEPKSAYPLTGHVTLSPPNSLPSSTTLVTYSTSGGGGFTATTNAAPFTSDWNTARFPNGLYTLRTVACDANERVLSDTSQTVQLSNPDAPPSQLLSETQRAEFRLRLADLLTPRVCRKAAHFALARIAASEGDPETAIHEIEATVAIDPRFDSALAMLKTANQALVAHPLSYWRGITKDKIVALTFDDGPNPAPAYTPALLTVLENEKVKATFFVVGARAEQSVNLLQRMAADGDEIANHSYSHSNLTYLDADGVERELCRTSVIVREATGQWPHFYRPPGGNFTRAEVDAASSLGMAGAYWTIDGVRFEMNDYPPARLTAFVLSKLRPGAIILMHNAPQNTIAALPGIIAGIRAKGYRMVTMSELARVCKPGGGGSASGAAEASR